MQFEDIMKLVLGKGKQDVEGEEQKPSQPKASLIPKMRKGSWRHHLDSNVHTELNKLVRNTHKHRNAYKKTLKVRDAQLWVALAQMSRRLSQMESQLGVQQSDEPGTQQAESLENEAESLTSQVPESRDIKPITPLLEKEKLSQNMLISGESSSSSQPEAPSEQPVSAPES